MKLNELEELLAFAKKHAYHERKKKAAGKQTFAKVRIKKQAELEWTKGQTLCLIHQTDDGKETALGLFTEYLRGTSRWLKPCAETISSHHTEIVTGSWWLHPNIREIPVDSPQEVKAIRARFEMLIDEISSELGLGPVIPTPALQAIDDFDDEDDDRDPDDDEDDDDDFEDDDDYEDDEDEDDDE